MLRIACRSCRFAPRSGCPKTRCYSKGKWEKQVKHKLAWCSIYVSLCFLSIWSTIFTLSKVHLLQTAQYPENIATFMFTMFRSLRIVSVSFQLLPWPSWRDSELRRRWFHGMAHMPRLLAGKQHLRKIRDVNTLTWISMQFECNIWWDHLACGEWIYSSSSVNLSSHQKESLPRSTASAGQGRPHWQSYNWTTNEVDWWNFRVPISLTQKSG